ncbi:MAG: hypothetical protein ACREM3_24690, partial [Candidatus Rokuibacteriota bacterium]
ARRGERGVIEADPGRLVLVRRKGGPTLAMVLAVHGIRGHRALVEALLPHGAVVRVKAGVIKQVFWSTPTLAVPRDAHAGARGRDGRGLRHLADQLARLDVAALLERERAHRPEASLGSVECHRCPWGSTPRCDAAWREVERLAERVAQRRGALDAIRGAYWQEFLRVVEVLEQFGAVREGRLEARGRLVAGLRHDNELLVAEVVTRGILTDLTVAEAAAVCSALGEESRSGEPMIARVFLRSRPKLRRKLEQLGAVAEAVAQAQRQRHLGMPVAVHPGFMPAVFRWVSGDDDWSGIVQQSFGGHEGDLIRAMRRLIDLLRQLGESAEVPATTGRLLLQAARLVDRGIVLESALI